MVASAEGTENTPTGSKRATVAELEAQLEVLRAEVQKLSAQIESSSEISLRAMRRAAAAGVDQLKAQGESAMDGLRSNAHDLEDQLYATVREKPATSLAIAAGAGFLFALLARR